MRNAIALSLLAAMAVSCLVAGASFTRADDVDDNLPKRSRLGKNWKKVSDALDEAYEAMQADAGVEPAPLVDDDLWLRRVYLDLTGAPPSPDEIQAFHPKDGDPDKRAAQARREAVVEYLLATPEFEHHMATWWTTILVGRPSNTVTVRGGGGLFEYLRRSFELNQGWDKTVHGLFADTRGVVGTPEYSYLNFLAASNDLAYMAGSTSRVFLGRQIQCAQCHDSKIDAWTKDDFEAWQAFFKSFTEEYKFQDQNFLRLGQDLTFRTPGDLQAKLDLKGEYKLPRFLDGRDWSAKDRGNLRESMADWLTSRDNPWFSEMTVNRYMGYFLGVAFVNPVDAFNSLNDPTIPVIMKVMGRDFVASGFDVRRLIRIIVNSKIYQRQSVTNDSNLYDYMYYSHQQVRELSPEMIERSILKVVGVEDPKVAPKPTNRKAEVAADSASPEMESSYAYRLRLHSLITQAFDGEDVQKSVDDRGGSLMRALMFMNGDILPKGPRCNLDDILSKPLRTKDRVELVFATVLGRYPTKTELGKLLATVDEWTDGKRAERDIYEDLFLSLMCTPEFVNRS
ncbi:MAG: DUF1553 domain-containing protein [Planctomycetes bacterium]|nr:DUF1553 domain-containing protein [Planctomycetota bacterium]